jgi:tRNA(Ile)-lysidine synthase
VYAVRMRALAFWGGGFLPASAGTILEAVRRGMGPYGDSPGVVAVSGGPDSIALLRACVDVASGPLAIAHLNHQLRGGQSDADEAFVRQVHADLLAGGAALLPLQIERINVATHADGDNLEATGRRLRYEWLAKVANALGASWIATGHTADDNAETVLHRLVRGTGLRGLAGIPPVRELAPGLVVIRPLLGVRRSEVMAFLADRNQPYRQDESNFDRRFTRNRIRHELLPSLAENFNPAIVELLNSLALQAKEADDLIGQEAAALLANVELPRAGLMVVLDAGRLNVVSPLVARTILRSVWDREKWPSGKMAFADWDRILQVVRGERPALDLPDFIQVRRVGRVLQICCSRPANH